MQNPREIQALFTPLVYITYVIGRWGEGRKAQYPNDLDNLRASMSKVGRNRAPNESQKQALKPRWKHLQKSL